jgi:hypothetical protein
VVRFSTLGLHSYWSDEAVIGRVHRPIADLLSGLPNSERTPRPGTITVYKGEV